MSRSLRPPRALRPAGAMGNCHTVGPNEALVVSGERAASEGGGSGTPRAWRVFGAGAVPGRAGAGLGSERGGARPGKGSGGGA